MFERIKNAYDVVSNPSRYRNPDEVDLEETADPTSWRDQTKPTLTERFASRKRVFLSLSFLGFIVLGLLAAYSKTYLPGLYGSVWVKRGLVAMVATPTLFFAGASWMRSKLRSVDRLDLVIDGEPTSFYGAHSTDSNGNDVFQPLKGFDWLGMRGSPLTLSDLDEDFHQAFAKEGRDPDSPAKIRVEDAVSGVAETATGKVVVAQTGGLELDPYGRESDIYTVPPDLADKEQYRRLVRTTDKVHDRNAELRDKVSALEERRDYWKGEAQKEREEIVADITKTHSDLAEAGFRPRKERESGRIDPTSYPLQNGDSNS
ncbi:hypothetical protein C2R22_24570 (plasmid) [Salinigranum rubrum]|uniref:Uncharacterized protein n=1 Tax=Salinigranum rubrum TaxID=755307 RepID=A0A2I8VS46_9EURY|nr:hypothetical protein [Salinigranum rubrum]AUV84706.1 hypothetical protein C2R22_24570 [Salinigranum rubrum]